MVERNTESLVDWFFLYDPDTLLWHGVHISEMKKYISVKEGKKGDYEFISASSINIIIDYIIDSGNNINNTN